VTPPRVIQDVVTMQGLSKAQPRAVVMTMGALHQGHANLIAEARQAVGESGDVVVTIFVNPLQFGSVADLHTYPQTWAADLQVCGAAGANIVFAPKLAEMYPPGYVGVLVDPGPLGRLSEGEVRPGHFQGVLTVVLKLLNMVRPDVALFGEKDYQQLVLVQAMVQVFNVPVEVQSSPITRDEDGLALSSRNVRLSPEAREVAQAIPRAIKVGQRLAASGADPACVERACTQVLKDVGILPDYVTIYGPGFTPMPLQGPARLVVAAYVGGVHLLDNGPVFLGEQP
jgi:pantoate--beta-alanine ligase